MSKLLTYFSKILYSVTVLLLSVSIFRLFQHRWVNYFTVKEAVKDEVGFQNAFHDLLVNGWYENVASGVSIIYNLSAFPLYLITGTELLSLRLVNFLAMLGIVLISWLFLRRQLKPDSKIAFILLLFLINIGCRSVAYFSATSDAVFIFFMTASFYTFYRLQEVLSDVKIRYALLTGLFLALALSTRELFVFYIPGFVLGLILFLMFQKISIKNTILLVVVFLGTVFVLHFPSIFEHRKLSVHDKNFDQVGVTWAEMNYLSLIENKDKLIYGRNTKKDPITPERVLAYRKIHGESALPKTYFDGIVKDPVLTLKNFIGLVYLSQLPFVLQQALFYVLFVFLSLIYLVNHFRIKSKPDWLYLLPFIFFIVYTCTFCVTPIRHIEFRHFMFFTFFISVFGIIELLRLKWNNEIKDCLLLVNMCVISIPNILLLGIW